MSVTQKIRWTRRQLFNEQAFLISIQTLTSRDMKFCGDGADGLRSGDWLDRPQRLFLAPRVTPNPATDHSDSSIR